MDISVNEKIYSALSGSQLSATLKSEKGITLIEALVTVAILVGVVVTIYIGVIYAENQIMQNYRDRVATLLASGELEMQHYYYSTSQTFRPFTRKDVIIDYLPRNKVLMGNLSISIKKDTEYAAGQVYNMAYLIAKVSWIDPKTRKERFITLREDYY